MQRTWTVLCLTLIALGVVSTLNFFTAPAAVLTSGGTLEKLITANSELFPAQETGGTDYARLAEKAEKGRVRIIIGLENPAMPFGFQPEGALDKAGRTAQRTAIHQTSDSVLAQLQEFPVSGIKQFQFVPYLAMEVDAAALTVIKNMPEVKSITEDHLAAPTLQTSVPLIHAPQAWAAGGSGAGQTVAVLDTGIDKNHEFLAGKVVSEACYSTAENYVSTSLCPNNAASSTASGAGMNCDAAVTNCNHGTHVAGIVAGKNTAAQIYGVAKDAALISIQVFSQFDASTCGNAPCVLSYTSDQMRGLERVYALRNTYPIAAVNMSLGGGQYTTNCDYDPLKPTIDNLRSVGIATIVASGNNGYPNALSGPACISTAVSVGSTISSGIATDTASGFSNRASFLTLYAPGQTIISSLPNNTYGGLNGTSMAAPHIAGAWAILKQKVPNASVAQILNALVTTGVPVTANGITKPRIKIDDALAALAGPTAAGVAVSGRILSAEGRGIAKARVTLLDISNGETRSVLSNPFGYYSFADIPAGTNYILDAQHKGYQFAPQNVFLAEANNQINLVALPND